MKQLTRRLTSLLLAMAMVMSFAAIAFAAEESTSSDTSADVSPQSAVEVDPGIEAQDLFSDTSDLKSADASTSSADASTSADASSSADDSSVKEDASAEAEVPADASEAAADASEEQKAEETSSEDASSEVAPAPQEGAGWTVSGGSYALKYTNEGSEATATDALFYVPETTATVGTDTYTFKAGVYAFDSTGVLVVDTDYTADTATVTVLDASLAQVSSDSRKLKINGQTKVDGTTVTPGAAFFTGNDNGSIYLDGVAFNGYYRANAADALYSVANGAASLYSGQMVATAALPAYMVDGQSTADFDGLWYYQGAAYTGLFRSGAAADPNALYVANAGTASLFSGRMVATYGTYLVDNAANNQFDELYYADGYLFTGFYEDPETQLVSLISAGAAFTNTYNGSAYFTGLMQESVIGGVTFNVFLKDNVKNAVNGLYYQNGQLYTGVPNTRPSDGNYPVMNLFVNGVAQQVADGWYRAPRADEDFWKPNVYYYFQNNVALTGNNKKLKAIQQGKYKDGGYYYYSFAMTGVLVTNLYYHTPAILKSGNFRIYCDHTTYTGTVLMYNNKDKKTNGGWNIPVKSFVISMSRSKNPKAADGTKFGNYALATGSNGWYKFVSPKTHQISYFSGSRHIWGSGSMFHGAAYKFDAKKVTGQARRYKMQASSYNKFGTAQTQHCVRVQDCNMYLLGELFNNSPKKKNHGRKCATRVRVFLTNGTKKMPFGQMTILNNFDLNGYVVQNANTGTGKNMSFDPTDYRTKGSTIYISKTKTSNKNACTQIKMYAAKKARVAYELA